MMSIKNSDYEPMNETWLSIITAVTTALFVNVVTAFTLQVTPVIQVIVLFAACIMIGLHARRRSEGMIAIQKRIELESLLGSEKAGDRRAVIKDEWDLRRDDLTRTKTVALFLIAISMGLLVYRGWEQRKSIDAETRFRYEVVQEFQELKKAIHESTRQEPAPGANKR
jgi:hypothetical protein